MIKILGSAEQPCFVSGKTGRGVLNLKFDDKSFAGALHVEEMMKQIERRSKNGKPDDPKAGSKKAELQS